MAPKYIFEVTMNRIMVLKAKNADKLEELLNNFFVQIQGLDARIISIVKDGKNIVAFINVEAKTPQAIGLEQGSK